MKLCSNDHNKVKTPHMAMCLDVHTRSEGWDIVHQSVLRCSYLGGDTAHEKVFRCYYLDLKT